MGRIRAPLSPAPSTQWPSHVSFGLSHVPEVGDCDIGLAPKHSVDYIFSSSGQRLPREVGVGMGRPGRRVDSASPYLGNLRVRYDTTLRPEATRPWGRPRGKPLGRNVQLSPSSSEEAPFQDLPCWISGMLWVGGCHVLSQAPLQDRGSSNTDVTLSLGSVTNWWETLHKCLFQLHCYEG